MQDMLSSWHEMLPQKMQEWELDRGEMVELFGSTRDAWITNDVDGWLAPNRIYDGVADAMKAAMASPDAEVFIVTTKQVCYVLVSANYLCANYLCVLHRTPCAPLSLSVLSECTAPSYETHSLRR